MASNDTFEGGCTCRHVRYRMTSRPMFVHCCHCRWCQRETGAAFALNAMIEADRVELTAGEPEVVITPSASGKGQKIWRCPQCKVAVWSNYAGAGDKVRFVRVGTLDEPDAHAARHPHLHHVQAALGRAARRHAGGAGVLQGRARCGRRKARSASRRSGAAENSDSPGERGSSSLRVDTMT